MTNGQLPEEKNNETGKTSGGLDQNVAGLLTYLAGAITGIIFLIIEKENRFVRFHAMQSIFVTVGLFIVSFVLGLIPILGWLLLLFIGPLTLVLWIVLMVQAYQGKYFKLPWIGDMAEKQVDNMK
ncbi:MULTISPECIES: DUF4870 domain-containing protein [Gracilibacillus]|uniref:DUF4870 domain-containing protein n=1 Tax=Gracilibacillus TaxID=74385 RepID=UPI00082419B5|nr:MULTISPECIES: DUF4870 domain-containing protein [Gracilibacillus]